MTEDIETNEHLLSVTNYNIPPWNKKFADFKVDLTSLKINSSWKPFFRSAHPEKTFIDLNRYLSFCLTKTLGKVNIFPYPDLIFNALNCTDLQDIKVVILGQDPYHQAETFNGELIPQAMGLSFSVPNGVPIPSSLINIYKNLVKYGHIWKVPSHGNLCFWAYQGCLLLNSSLTVQKGHPGSDLEYWEDFTDKIIKYISDELNHIVFLLWGAPALKKLDLIKKSKHKVIISSHPSGLSYNKSLRNYGAFIEVDHFGLANKYLIKHGKNPIIWQII